MGTPMCLYSRTIPGTPTPKKARGFLALPGELRNTIYTYYFQGGFRCEFAAKGCQFFQPPRHTVKLWSGLVPLTKVASGSNAKIEDGQPFTIRVSRPLGKYSAVQGLQTNWPMSLHALNLVCKVIYEETLTFLYRKTIFFFNAPKRINNFLNIVSKPKLEHITRLQLHYDTYGDPTSSQDTVWQDKHHRSWLVACKHASKKLVSLNELEIWVQLHAHAPKFNLRETWVLPLLQFRRLTRKMTEGPDLSMQKLPRLHDVKVHLRTPFSRQPLRAFNGNHQLGKASTDLHSLFSEAVAMAIAGKKEDEAMAKFTSAWNGKHSQWCHHLGFAKTGW